ncbi:hypothetical protein [Limobrevibacterium gyesilva]|uniref:Uncharacterized protein n=1 Tax=Limobrevibacterium gyesilva TaxID=2991712 RepID=A0AA41YP64_9PROT|nr:hypothetical protein [Limobrevibacterium gyesilva]MCW3472977.1 hypothetical protein [Limobrevibacterium gyesilva]
MALPAVTWPELGGVRYMQPIRRRSVGLWLCVGLAVFLATDAAIFRSGWYFQWIEPLSALGQVRLALANARAAPQDRQAVLVIGDSRVGEGFSAPLATAAAERLGRPTAFVNAAVGGTNPRAWFYILRQILASDRRYAAVVMMAPSYHDNDPLALADALTDIAFVHPLLGWADVFDFPASFHPLAAKIEAMKAFVTEGSFYKTDVTNLLDDPQTRMQNVELWRDHGVEWLGAYAGRAPSLAGLRADDATGALSVPAGLLPLQTAGLAEYGKTLHAFAGRFPDNPGSAQYRRLWYGRIAALCAQAGVKLIVFRIPRGPLHSLVAADPQPTGTLADLQAGGRLALLSATQFDDLERPEYFFDYLHLNSGGRVLFSGQLAEAVLQRLPPAK